MSASAAASDAAATSPIQGIMSVDQIRRVHEAGEALDAANAADAAVGTADVTPKRRAVTPAVVDNDDDDDDGGELGDRRLLLDQADGTYIGSDGFAMCPHPEPLTAAEVDALVAGMTEMMTGFGDDDDAAASAAAHYDSASGLKLPEDPRTGQVGMTTKDAQASGLNGTYVFPIPAFALKAFSRTHGTTTTLMLCQLPIVDVPVYASRLSLLMRLNSPGYPTESAFSQLRLYDSVLHVYARMNRFYTEEPWTADTAGHIRCRADSIFTWLVKLNRKKQLEEAHIDIAYSFIATMSEEHDKEADRMALKKMVRAGDGAIRDRDIFEFMSHISDSTEAVAQFTTPQEAPWMTDVGHMCAEDVYIIHYATLTCWQQEVERIIREVPTDDAVECTQATRRIMVAATIELMRVYEKSLITLFSAAALAGSAIPQELTEELQTTTSQPDPASVVHVNVMPQVASTRALCTAVHDFFRLGTKDTKAALLAAFAGVDATAAHASAPADSSGRPSLAMVLDFDTDDVDAVAKYAAQATAYCVPSDADVESFRHFVAHDAAIAEDPDAQVANRVALVATLREYRSMSTGFASGGAAAAAAGSGSAGAAAVDVYSDTFAHGTDESITTPSSSSASAAAAAAAAAATYSDLV